MSVSGGPDIVQDGLVLHLDAGNPRSYRSGSDNGPWYDLSNNGNDIPSSSIVGATFVTGTPLTGLQGIPAFNFNGNHISLGPYISNAQNITISTWFSINTNINTMHLWHEGTGSAGDGYGPEPEVHLTLRFRDINHTIGVYGIGGLEMSTTFSSSTNYYNATVTLGNMSGSNTTVTASLYLDGNLGTTMTGSINRSQFTSPLRLGKSISNVIRQYGGYIPMVTIHNRVLTSDEILQNFNAQRFRFKAR